MRRGRIDLDDVTHCSIEGAMSELWWQLDAKHLEETADLILEIVAYLDQLEVDITCVGLESDTLAQHLTYGPQSAGFE